MSSSESDCGEKKVIIRRKKRGPTDILNMKHVPKIYKSKAVQQIADIYKKIRDEQKEKISEASKDDLKNSDESQNLNNKTLSDESDIEEDPLYMKKLKRAKKSRQNKKQKESLALLKEVQKLKEETCYLENKLEEDDVVLVSSKSEESIVVCVNYKNKIYHFYIKINSKMDTLYDQVSQKLQIPVEKLFIASNDRKIEMDNTAKELQNSGEIKQILECVVLYGKESETPKQPNFKIFLQSGEKRSKREFYIEETDPLEQIFEKYAEEIFPGKKLSEISFKFDDEPVDMKQSCKQLDIECEECIDVKLISK